MNKSLEAEAMAHIQSLRPNAKKHGLGGMIFEYYMRQELPKIYKDRPKRAWTRCRDYKLLKEAAEDFRPSFIPDLTEFYGDDGEIIIYEIEDKAIVTESRLKTIWNWIGRMDDWDEWHVLLIITNRFGRGWDTLIDTKKSWRNHWLSEFKKDSPRFLEDKKDLDTEEKIIKATAWRNWPFGSVIPPSQ